MKKFFREYAISFSLITVILLVLTGTGFIFWNKKASSEDLALKNQADLVKREVRFSHDEVTRHVDVTLRGFAIIKDKKFIYIENKQIRLLMENNFRRLDSLLAIQNYTDPEGLLALKAYKDTIRSFVNYHESMIGLLKADSLDKFKQIFNTDKGKNLGPVLTRVTQKIYGFEDSLTTKAQARYNAAMEGNIYVQILLILFSIPTILILLAKFQTGRQIPYFSKVILDTKPEKENLAEENELGILLQDHISKRDKKLLEEFNLYLEQNISNPEINVEEISKAVGVSRVQLYRKVKTLTGSSVNNYMQNLRLDKAKKLLLENDLSVSEIAYVVGFSSPNYFSTVFKNKFQVVPSEYRDALKSEVLK